VSELEFDLVAVQAPRDPEELEAAAPPPVELGASTRLGPVHVTVASLERSVEYYRRAVGLELLKSKDGRASLGAGGRELLVLVEELGATSSDGHTGLYHFALLVPHRRDLAAWLAHAARDRVPLVGLSDHFVSEAIYLEDPDGHGIEIYWDRPRALWEGQVGMRMATFPLDVESLLGELEDPRAELFDGLAAGTAMGHVHLKVAAIPATVAFYRDGLGLALMAQLGPQAAFLSAGGYHHHVGTNTWESGGSGPPPAGTAALRHVTIVLADAAELDTVRRRLDERGHFPETADGGVNVRDPSGNRLLLTAAE
jgi:catechol 2,3-dioxygenase